MKMLFSALIVLLLTVTAVAAAIPDIGRTGIDNSYNDTAPWIVCNANESNAWISSNPRGTYNPTVVCQELGYRSVSAYGGTWGTVCGTDHVQGVELYNGAGGDETYLRYTVHWRCEQFVGDNDIPVDEVPEFSTAASIAVLIAAGALLYVYRR